MGASVFQLQAKADAIAEPILAEAVESVAAEERPEGEGGHAGGSSVLPSGEHGRRDVDGAPAPKDQTRAASSHPTASEV